MTTPQRSSALALMIAAGILVSATQATGAELRGRVLDEGGHGIGGALVSVIILDGPLAGREYRATTDVQGAYVVEDIPFGEYAAEASALGFVSVRFRPIKVAYLRVTWNFRLPLAAGGEGGVFKRAEVIGTLRAGSSTLSLATICLSAGQTKTCAASNNLGEYHLSVDPGDYVATVVVGGVEKWKGTVKFPQPGEYRDSVMK